MREQKDLFGEIVVDSDTCGEKSRQVGGRSDWIGGNEHAERKRSCNW